MEEVKVSMPLLGDKFPEMKVRTTHGDMMLPEDKKGKWFVLFSHPGDFTPVCTTEFIAFAKKNKEFAKLNTDLIGLSVDQLQSHLKWVEWIKDNANVDVPFPIIADELGLAATKLGMLHPSKGTSTVRAVFIVDDKGILRLMMYYPQEVGRSVDEVLRSLVALQDSEKYHLAMPENYPNNEFLGKNHGVIPPASSVEAIKDRKERAKNNEFTYLDWWLCHKEIKKDK